MIPYCFGRGLYFLWPGLACRKMSCSSKHLNPLIFSNLWSSASARVSLKSSCPFEIIFTYFEDETQPLYLVHLGHFQYAVRHPVNIMNPDLTFCIIDENIRFEWHTHDKLMPQAHTKPQLPLSAAFVNFHFHI